MSALACLFCSKPISEKNLARHLVVCCPDSDSDDELNSFAGLSPAYDTEPDGLSPVAPDSDDELNSQCSDYLLFDEFIRHSNINSNDAYR